MRRSSLLYLTRADPHDVTFWRTPLSRERLRCYLMLYGMLFDKLTTGDSQFLNNAVLRSLIWPGEARADSGVPADLALLLQGGVLLPAIRDSAGSLLDVWRDLVSRQVVEVGSEEYAQFVHSHLGSRNEIVYRANTVSSYFRDQVLAAFASDNEQLHLNDRIRQAVYDHVGEQETLYYIRLRQWMDKQVELGRITEYQRRTVDRAVGWAYRLNVPKAVDGAQVDMQLDPNKGWMPVDIQLGLRKSKARDHPENMSIPIRPFAVSPYVLARLPAQTLLAIRAEPARRPVLRMFGEYQRTGRVDTHKLHSAIENFLYSAERIAYVDARGELQDLIKRRRKESRSANLKILGGAGLAVASMSIFGAIGADVGYASLVFTAYASVRAIRDRGKEYQHGFALGRIIPPEDRILMESPS